MKWRIVCFKMFFIYFLYRLACTCEEACESVWPLNASLYASSTCVHLRLLAGPFAQGFTGLLVWRKWGKFNIKKILSACVGVDLFACRIHFKKDENVETCASEQVLFLPQLLLILQSDWLICRCRFQFELWKKSIFTTIATILATDWLI